MGLKVGTVKLEKYDSNWKEMFLKEKENLEKCFGDIALEIEHVGSTSVEGLSAKPIIDIQIAIEDFSKFESLKEFFSKEPYSIKDDSGDDEILIRRGSEENRTHFIHVVEKGSLRYINTLLFRNYLRSNKDVMLEYEKLKLELAEKYFNDRKMYTLSKNDFIQKVIKCAKDNK